MTHVFSPIVGYGEEAEALRTADCSLCCLVLYVCRTVQSSRQMMRGRVPNIHGLLGATRLRPASQADVSPCLFVMSVGARIMAISVAANITVESLWAS